MCDIDDLRMVERSPMYKLVDVNTLIEQAINQEGACGHAMTKVSRLHSTHTNRQTDTHSCYTGQVGAGGHYIA